MSAFGTIETAVEAMREGAYDFITKPLKRALAVKTVMRALEKRSLFMENMALKEQLKEFTGEKAIIGTSPLMRGINETIRQVAPSTATVLITGESGTGKELVARSVHLYSNRRFKPFTAMNCAAIPATLLESELFGHEKGAFTGAYMRKEGRFKVADGGTLFLDEICEMDPLLQVKLLRVLQEGEFERVGGTQPVKVDVRIIASSNRNILEEVKARRFREDLYYRLNVININLPPLRDRKEDISLLAHHFLKKYAEKNSKTVVWISKDVMESLTDYNWPGNVRELENVMERAVVMCKGDTIRMDDIPQLLDDDAREKRYFLIQMGTPLEEIEQKVIQETLKMTKGNKRIAAHLLGIATRTIYRKIDSDPEKTE